MNRFICIHGHFYQPPRENPWLEAVELQDSAQPYHDWNGRITAECYAPNTASRILNPERKIIDIVNNYSKISFNFGPTLLAWLQKHNADIYYAIIEADKKSRDLFSGHGAALAQAYNHMILPLATPRDKQTQIVWGLKDFETHFQRRPEGMWLPETAVDLETLEILAENGIIFTILAPRQAFRVRKAGDKTWQDVSDASIDPKMPYVCKLPSGKSITIFFYDGQISQEVAFRGLLENGEHFARRLANAFTGGQEVPQLVHIATDGETYGHHHRNGDMALAYCLYFIESNKLATITIYGAFLEKYPPSHEVEIFEHSSWSCAHGVGRWKDDCGCNSGMQAGWRQTWRAPLRGAMDWLRDNLTQIFEERLTDFAADPWKVRNGYIDVILDRSTDNVEKFFRAHAARQLTQEEKSTALKLLEMQRQAMLMYTSCGWFFDEISAIETVQIMQYAARAMQLAQEVRGIALEDAFIGLLQKAPSNIATFKDGASVYTLLVKPAVIDLLRVGVHYAVSSLFKEYEDSTGVYSYTAKKQTYDCLELGKQRLAIGRVSVRSDIVWAEEAISFSVLHFGDHNLICGARPFLSDDAFTAMHSEIKEGFLRGEISEVIRLIDKHFSDHNFSLWHLFRDEQRDILSKIFTLTLKEIDTTFRQVYEQHYPIMQVVEGLSFPLPKHFSMVLAFILNNDMRAIFESDDLDIKQLRSLVAEANRWTIELDKQSLSFLGSKKITAFMEHLSFSIDDMVLMGKIRDLLKVLQDMALELEMWRSQNIYFFIGKQTLSSMRAKAEKGDTQAVQWVELFTGLGNYLRVSID